MNNTVLSKIESDKRKVESQELANFADVFEVSTDYLTGREKVSGSKAKDSGMAFYGGGKDWTDEEIEFADALIQKLREQKEAKTKTDKKS